MPEFLIRRSATSHLKKLKVNLTNFENNSQILIHSKSLEKTVLESAMFCLFLNIIMTRIRSTITMTEPTTDLTITRTCSHILRQKFGGSGGFTSACLNQNNLLTIFYLFKVWQNKETSVRNKMIFKLRWMVSDWIQQKYAQNFRYKIT